MFGTGTQRKIRDCKEYRLKVPAWKQKENTTTVTFPEVAHSRTTEGIIEFKGANRTSGYYLTKKAKKNKQPFKIT